MHGLEGDDLGPGRVRAAQHLPEVGGVVVPEDVLGDAAVADALREKTNKIETIAKKACIVETSNRHAKFLNSF